MTHKTRFYIWEVYFEKKETVFTWRQGDVDDITEGSHPCDRIGRHLDPILCSGSEVRDGDLQRAVIPGGDVGMVGWVLTEAEDVVSCDDPWDLVDCGRAPADLDGRGTVLTSFDRIGRRSWNYTKQWTINIWLLELSGYFYFFDIVWSYRVTLEGVAMSLTMTGKMTGPNNVPWGTPQVRFNYVEVFWHLTVWEWLDKNLQTVGKMEASTPKLMGFFIAILWLTNSNVLITLTMQRLTWHHCLSKRFWWMMSNMFIRYVLI